MEFIRKFFVSLKRSPQNIPLVALAVAFLVYSLNLTSIANTTARINSANMGQCEFAAMLFSILAFVCFLRAFPRRQKPSVPMLSLLFAMMAVLIFVDIVYITRINQAIAAAPSDKPLITTETAYISGAQSTVMLHIIFVGISVALLATLPIYAKFIRKINTSIEVDGNEDMGTIDISGEE